MIRAIIAHGAIVPRDPLPADWQEGTEVTIEKSISSGPLENGFGPTDAWMDEVEAIAAQGDPEDDRRLEAALQVVHAREKELARKRTINP